jgi:hypothetical protein
MSNTKGRQVKGKPKAKIVPINRNTKVPEIDLEKEFEGAKQVMINTLNVQIIKSKNIETYVLIRNERLAYFKDSLNDLIVDPCNIRGVKSIATEIHNLYKTMLDIVQAITLEDMCVEEIADPFAGLYSGYEECATDDEMFVNYLKYKTVQPFAEKLIQLHSCVQESLKIKEASNGTK